jgi:hypothetical protein
MLHNSPFSWLWVTEERSTALRQRACGKQHYREQPTETMPLYMEYFDLFFLVAACIMPRAPL